MGVDAAQVAARAPPLCLASAMALATDGRMQSKLLLILCALEIARDATALGDTRAVVAVTRAVAVVRGILAALHTQSLDTFVKSIPVDPVPWANPTHGCLVPGLLGAGCDDLVDITWDAFVAQARGLITRILARRSLRRACAPAPPPPTPASSPPPR